MVPRLSRLLPRLSQHKSNQHNKSRRSNPHKNNPPNNSRRSNRPSSHLPLSKSRQPHNSKNQHHSSSRLRPRHLSQIRLLITLGVAPTSALTATKIIIPATKTPAKMLMTLTLTTALITRPRTTTALLPPRVLPTEQLPQTVALNPRHSAL